MIRKWSAILLLAALAAVSASAKEIEGVSLPDFIDAGKGKLLLNGAGVRVKYMKLYVAGLYLVQNSQDAAKIVPADEHMAIRLHVIYKDGIPGKKWTQGWKKSFEDANQNISFISDKIARFCAFFENDARQNDVYLLLYTPGEGVKVSKNDQALGIIEGLDFKEALFSIWLGKIDKGDSKLKAGMLGQ